MRKKAKYVKKKCKLASGKITYLIGADAMIGSMATMMSDLRNNKTRTGLQLEVHLCEGSVIWRQQTVTFENEVILG